MLQFPHFSAHEGTSFGLEVADDVSAASCSQCSPYCQFDVGADRLDRAVAKQRVHDADMVAARQDRTVTCLSRVRPFLSRREISVIGDSLVRPGDVGVWRQRRSEPAVMTMAVGPFGMASSVASCRLDAVFYPGIDCD